MEENNKIFIWSPFTSKVGTVKNVINFANGLADYSKKKQFTYISPKKLHLCKTSVGQTVVKMS